MGFSYFMLPYKIFNNYKNYICTELQLVLLFILLLEMRESFIIMMSTGCYRYT